ncbi:Crp/Fnr family transcriptional regulator [Marivirga sp. S37H4]|uniref:Crp/Fnr family transcriptional regulator n=1 Tax=Marivirga aurantiaca TaxID=2802615 RepID=A0A934X081_9BACT|nr:Crp/Fnr family transcriptional regulator [Marivirga aurantiaca]MBK6266077.1 Crp/Fnr family transcriptional regulator [Marivirga aurantiaca]
MNEDTNIQHAIESISEQYSPLTDNCRSDLCNLLRIQTIPKNTVLVKEGQFANKTYFIVKGCLRAYYLKEGKDITDWLAFDNEFINSINSYFLEVPSPHFIETLESTKLIEFCKKDVETLLDKYPDFDRLLRIAVTKVMLQLQQRIVSIQFETAIQKYESLLIQRPDITARVPLTHIASFLGITLETLSRIRNIKSRI